MDDKEIREKAFGSDPVEVQSIGGSLAKIERRLEAIEARLDAVEKNCRRLHVECANRS